MPYNTDSRKKIVILGGSGMLGHIMALILNEYYDVTCILRKKISILPKSVYFDFENLDELINIIYQINPIAVINTLGVLIDESEINPKMAVKINSVLPNVISRSLLDSQIKFIQISSDCIFNGSRGPYYHNSIPDSIDFYGMTKYIGEIQNNKDLTIRTSIIGPDINLTGVGLFNWFMNEEVSIKGYKNVLWNGVTSLQLSEFINFALKENLTGIIHLSSPNAISKHDLLVLINKTFRNESIDIIESYELKSNKTLKPSLDSARYNIPSYDQMVYEMKRWILKHPTVYSHYIDMIKS